MFVWHCSSDLSINEFLVVNMCDLSAKDFLVLDKLFEYVMESLCVGLIVLLSADSYLQIMV